MVLATCFAYPAVIPIRDCIPTGGHVPSLCIACSSLWSFMNAHGFAPFVIRLDLASLGKQKTITLIPSGTQSYGSRRQSPVCANPFSWSEQPYMKRLELCRYFVRVRIAIALKDKISTLDISL